MARATFVKAARKDYPEHGIKKGESYYWWKFRFGSKRYSKTAPRRSQLTQSNFLSQLYDLEDEIGDFSCETPEELRDAIDDFTSRIRELGEECQSSFDNMPEPLQQGDTGQLLEGRVSSCEEWADEIEGVEVPEWSDPDDRKKEYEEEKKAAKEAGDEDFEEKEDSEFEGPTDEERDELETAIEALKSATYNGE